MFILKFPILTEDSCGVGLYLKKWCRMVAMKIENKCEIEKCKGFTNM